MAPAAASGGSTLPSGFSVFTTFPDLLFIFEFVSGLRPGKGPGGLSPALSRAPRTAVGLDP
ncbi:Myelin and lymphocyte protein [Plecturocebus cupreus]